MVYAENKGENKGRIESTQQREGYPYAIPILSLYYPNSRRRVVEGYKNSRQRIQEGYKNSGRRVAEGYKNSGRRVAEG